MGYKEDLAAAVKRQADIITQQVFFEVIRVVVECETYEEFRKTMYGIAIGYLKELEDAYGDKLPKPTNSTTTTDSPPTPGDPGDDPDFLI